MKGMEYIHTEFPRLPAWVGPVPERAGKRQPVAAGNLREGELKMAGLKTQNTQMHRRIAVLRHSHSTTVPVPTLSLERAQQVVRIPLKAGGKPTRISYNLKNFF